MEEGGHKQGTQQSLETRKDKETGIPPGSTEVTQAYQYLDFSPMRPISDFWPLELLRK